MIDDLQTHPSLLFRLKVSPNEADWETFFKQYSKVIHRFCQKLGLDDASARDVIQETMLLLMRKLPTFDYNPQVGRFRNWLFSLVAGKTRDAMRRARRKAEVEFDEEIDEKERCEEYIAAQEKEMKRAWMLGLVEDALRRIQKQTNVTDKNLIVFREYMIDGRSVEDVARDHHMDANAVYQVKFLYLKRIRNELSQMNISVA